mmetsp:Transcript_96850/g.172363  ORF Transcript_96850/g.172363 Transcript_96850/m.172363 type:complete len:114 (-) Transcript_96850:746-1087(-)
MLVQMSNSFQHLPDQLQSLRQPSITEALSQGVIALEGRASSTEMHDDYGSLSFLPGIENLNDITVRRELTTDASFVPNICTNLDNSAAKCGARLLPVLAQRYGSITIGSRNHH